MKYWGWLAAKLVVVGAIIVGGRAAIQAIVPRSTEILYSKLDPFAHDLRYTAAMMVFFLFCYSLLYLTFWDQKRRCRTCLRRLRMPIARGAWSNMLLFGQPRTEYICLYGHGTLRVPEVDLTGSKQPDWQPHDADIWKELEALESAQK
ncbi:MAG TPA: hypothetical protein VKU01_14855 [Bryobacteraceae bacterium]|nr:hypothetical protein [Bryobacteraceae bacterium]